ncbi:unnamed protein product [Cuscuta campestris]|uniref:GBF-interacting protein 1 N-terminal domain-containing protein n=1 Tax=Cuscuta campestris TaxID=132261 RepID=A0A484NA44_9ASTE|nr:unnamed protein product [Cuscuta campestris]
MSGGARVTIPATLRKTIQDIKEIAGDHSDEDILAVLKECKMDPNETAQKLFYIDTFHEVKRKRDRRKQTTNNQTSEDFKQNQHMQKREARGRGNYSSTHVSDAARRQKQRSNEQENGVRYSRERGGRGSVPTIAQSEKRAVAVVRSSSTSASATTEADISNGSSSLTQVAVRSSDVSIRSTADGNKLAKLPSVALKQFRYLNPGPTPTSTPTFSPYRVKDGNSKSAPSDMMFAASSTSASDVYSSASDPVLLSSLNPRNPGIVGTKKREIGTHRIANEAQSESSLNNVQGVLDGRPAFGTINSTDKIGPTESQAVAKGRLDGSSKPSQLIQDEFNQESERSEEVLASKADNVTSEAPPLFEFEDNLPKQLDMKLEKLKISAHQPVILPSHLQVPEAIKSGLTFGSLEVPIEQILKPNSKPASIPNLIPMEQVMNSSNDKPASIHDQTCTEISMSHQAPPRTAQEVIHPNNTELVGDSTTTGAARTFEQAKQEVLPLFGGSQVSHIQSPNYTLGLVPQVSSSDLVQSERSNQQGGNSQAQSTSGQTPPVSQPIGIGPSSTLSHQVFPFLRQPYASNYFPYNPYLAPFYMPQTAQQFLGPSGFAQQPSTANIYMPPSPGVKFPASPLYKSAAITGSLAHYGVPTGYSSYGSSVGYSLSEAPTSGGSTSRGDLAAAQLNEKNIYSTLKQSEEPHVWTSTIGRDHHPSMLPPPPANYFYNLPHHTQQVAFSPTHSTHGPLSSIYHPSPTVATPSSSIQQLPQQQTQAVVGGSPDALAPHQQLQHQINWNSPFFK